ncbi:MAG: hypothetical protein U0798_16880 [Gemmataceae bacterium]
MAESSYRSSPKLSQTTDEVVYTPISWLAIAAMVSSLVFVIVFVSLAALSIAKKQPMIMPILLVFPFITLVLTFAAYCHINNSEGTRTGKLFGLNLITISTAVGLLGGAGYISYLFAMEYAVRKDAEYVFTEWMKSLSDISPTDPNEPGVLTALHRTLDPANQQRVSATDYDTLRNAFSEPLVQFAQSDLVRICRRNPGKIKATPLGLVSWEREQQRIRCTLNAEITSPEGVHTISLEMIAEIAPNGSRIWGLQNKGSYVVARKLTPYGKAVEELETAASITGQRFIEPLGQLLQMRVPDPLDQEAVRMRLYHDFIAHSYPPAAAPKMIPAMQRVLLGGTAAAQDTSDLGYEKTLFKSVLTPIIHIAVASPEDRARLEADMRNKFEQIWRGSRFARSGMMIKTAKDIYPILTDFNKSIHITVPCEMLLPGSDAASNATRARLVFEVTDPKIVEKLAQMKSEADPSKAIPAGPVQTPSEIIPMRLIRIESDLKPGPQPQRGEATGGA